MKVKRQSNEDYTEKDILEVIKGFEQDKPITKKSACAILRINYNSTRITKIIEDYKEEKLRVIKRKKELRSVALSKADEHYIVSTYMGGDALQLISDSVYRSIGVIKRVLKKFNIPLRSLGNNYHNPIDLCHETNSVNDYKVKDLVYSARYGSPAEIMKVVSDGIYRIWVFTESQYAYQPYYELSDLRRVQSELGVTIDTMTQDEAQVIIRTALRDAKKRDKK